MKDFQNFTSFLKFLSYNKQMIDENTKKISYRVMNNCFDEFQREYIRALNDSIFLNQNKTKKTESRSADTKRSEKREQTSKEPKE